MFNVSPMFHILHFWQTHIPNSFIIVSVLRRHAIYFCLLVMCLIWVNLLIPLASRLSMNTCNKLLIACPL